MKILVQSAPSTLDAVRARVGQCYVGITDIVYTGDIGEMFRLVAEQATKPERTIVVSSNQFHGTEQYPEQGLLGGAMLASAVKKLDPNAWFFAYSLDWVISRHIDGSILKDFVHDRGHDWVSALLAFDFSRVSSVAELRTHFPWLK